MEIDIVKTVMDKNDEERRLQEKINWFEFMEEQPRYYVNVNYRSLANGDRSDDNDFIAGIENSVDYKRFLDEEYFVKNPEDKRFRRLFLLYSGLEEGDIENALDALGMTREQSYRLMDRYLTPKIQIAEGESRILS